MLTRTNILLLEGSLNKCSVIVKQKLFTAFSLYFYECALWVDFVALYLRKIVSGYYKCMKTFFRYIEVDLSH